MKSNSVDLEPRQKQVVYAPWQADVSDGLEHLPKDVIATCAPIVLEPMEELHILRWPTDPNDPALVSCRGAFVSP